MKTILLGIGLLLSSVLTAQTDQSSSVKAGNNSFLSNNEVPSLQSIRGNWFKADAPNQWEYGIYDSVCIIQNRMFTNKGIRKQGDCIELTVQDRKNAKIETILFTPQPNGEYLIKLNGINEQLYTKEGSTKPLMTTEADFKEFLRKDTAYIQGFVDRLDREMNSDTSLIMIGNSLTGEDNPTTVYINPDGSFECKLVLNYPIQNLLSIGNHLFSFYIEPGQTLTTYVDDQGSYDSIRFMGPSAALSQMYNKLEDLIRYSNESIYEARQRTTPDLFKKKLQIASAQCEKAGDSLAQVYVASPKAVHLIKNKLMLKKGEILLKFATLRNIFSMRDTTNQIPLVKEGNDYYDFLKQIPLNDQSLLADFEYQSFINMLEIMNPIREIQSEVYTQQFLSPSSNKNEPMISDKKQNKQLFNDVKEFMTKGDSVISQLSNQSNTFIWQTMLVRRLQLDLKTYSTPSVAKKQINALKKHLTYPILIAETDRIFDTTYSKKADKTYQLPEGKATEVFRNIIKAHPGKLLFVDFWSTGCGGCRLAIEATAQLRKDYKNHPEFQLIYITDERASPKKAYDAYVAKNLEGEVSYRISESQILLLRELFKFNTFPHYELIQKDGSVTMNPPTAWTLERYIKKHFDKSEEL